MSAPETMWRDRPPETMWQAAARLFAEARRDLDDRKWSLAYRLWSVARATGARGVPFELTTWQSGWRGRQL